MHLTHTHSLWTTWPVLGSVGLHLCREVGCLAASSGCSAIHPPLPSLPAPTWPTPPPPISATPSPPLRTTAISILPPFMWGAEVLLASTAVVWYSGSVMPDCLLGCHTPMHIDNTGAHAHTWALCTGFMCYHLLSRKLFCEEENAGCFKGLMSNTERLGKMMWKIPDQVIHPCWI